ncbi:radical SAM protein [Gemmatimonadota bacterium]
MLIDRKQLYRFPWSKTDNPGGWIEVTDSCNLACPACYRHQWGGHRDLDELKEEILLCHSITNCDYIRIAGGEPLIYPWIIEVVEFITSQGLKPVLLTNGVELTRELAVELKRAGLAQFNIHVDSMQNRPGWEGKTEVEMNELRQHYADLIWDVGGIQAGFNITVFPEILQELPDVMRWCRKNIAKVQQVRLIAVRGIPISDSIEYMVNGQKIDLSALAENLTDTADPLISSEDILESVAAQLPHFQPCAYLNGTSAPETNKLLVVINVGDQWGIYGRLGSKSVEFVQAIQHFRHGRFASPSSHKNRGKKVFILSGIDRELRKAGRAYLKMLIRHPQRLFGALHLQTIGIMQPGEIYKGKHNMCDGCLNMMIYKGELVNSCILDEYRMYGGALQQVIRSDRADDNQDEAIPLTRAQ